MRKAWAMLARSYSVLGRYKDAEGAYRKATGLRQDDAALWTDYAVMAMNQGGRLQGEAPLRWSAKRRSSMLLMSKPFVLGRTDLRTTENRYARSR